ncbi:uncharacterized protein LOC117116688 isoform X2 [Anneissia japonica]|nr:uncharacterized protein LOC117116688 isoform X2 [Anneissia japonica]XP_033116675.1 uncharacterized protein LOC117116688 isoform X2 [Anneissia japonica]XP_033116676.1 uncharacterized protein LOC117116688 isoform X2 [Anneissia japonica]XP_033116677.1 uncharacterized protein LOC117116688 isoform X2 [Anneissia japonica]XP_033116678.1 uncharacterized protein LOC117116688 isoform X2 [Anneissia japonica]XP_033116679.1 uncharacterized protein LOC117116688 isoform X2 [Anneissia japonica]
MATESEYHFDDSATSQEVDHGDVFIPRRTRLDFESFRRQIDCLSNSLTSLSEERDKLLEDRHSDRSKIIRLSAELLIKESQIQNINQLEGRIDELKNQHIEDETEKTNLKKDLTDKVVIIQSLQLKAAEEKKCLVEKNKELRRQILECESNNTKLKQEVTQKIQLLANWENKFELLEEENKGLASECRRLNSRSYSALELKSASRADGGLILKMSKKMNVNTIHSHRWDTNSGNYSR